MAATEDPDPANPAYAGGKSTGRAAGERNATPLMVGNDAAQ